MVLNDRKDTLHTDAVDKTVKTYERIVVLDGGPPPISSSDLNTRDRQTYGADRRTLCGNSAISRRETQIEMNMD